MATHRLQPQTGPRRSLPAGLLPIGNVQLPVIVMRGSKSLRGSHGLRPVSGFGDAPDFTPLLSQEQAALLRRTQDLAASQSLTSLTSAQKSALADEANRANWVTRYEALRVTAINNYNAAKTASAQATYAKQIAAYNLVISQQLPLLVAASAKLASLGIQPSAAAVVASYANGAPVGASRSAIPGNPPPPNVGNLPLGLPGQQPTVNQTVAVIQASGAGNNVPTSAPSAPYIPISSTSVLQPVVNAAPSGGGSSVPTILNSGSVLVRVAPAPAIQPPRAGTINNPVPVAAPVQYGPPVQPPVLQPVAAPVGEMGPAARTPTAPMRGPSGIPTINASGPVIDSMPPASQLFTDAAVRQTSPSQAGPTGDVLNTFVGNSNGSGAAANSVALANPLAPGAKQLIPGLDNKITLIGGAVLLLLLLKH